MHGLSVAQATDIANERLGIQRRQSQLHSKFRRWLLAARKTTQRRLGELDRVPSREALLPVVEELADAFAQLRRACGGAPNRP
ncbi:MAG: hypothetical protein ACREJM_14155 [Candidatus Saccharimonadales bacterium]